MAEQRYPATPEQLAALSVNWKRKHRDVRFNFRVTKTEADLIRRAIGKTGLTQTDFFRGCVLDSAKYVLGRLSDRFQDRYPEKLEVSLEAAGYRKINTDNR